MPTVVSSYPFNSREALFRVVCAGLATAIIDGLFSSVLVVAAYGSTFSRLFQGVAATLVGSSALTGGARTTALGVLMHRGVAFGWSALFVVFDLALSLDQKSARLTVRRRQGGVGLRTCHLVGDVPPGHPVIVASAAGHFFSVVSSVDWTLSIRRHTYCGIGDLGHGSVQE